MKKKILLLLTLLTISISSCSGVSSLFRPNCNASGDVCIEMKAVEPIKFGEPFTIEVTITSVKDIDDLRLSISAYPVDTLIEGKNGWEKRSVNWPLNVKTNQSITVTSRILLTPNEGSHTITAVLSRSGIPPAIDKLSIILTKKGGKVYDASMKTPGTPKPELLPTLEPDMATSLVATITARPTSTPLPQLPIMTPGAPESSTATSPPYPPPEASPTSKPYP